MRIALLLRGIVNLEDYIHHTGKVFNINYKDNLSNVLDNINILKQKHDVDIYLSTKHSNYNKDVINDFKPKNHIFLKLNTNQNDCLLAGLNLINDIYDFVIVTRFDLKLKVNLLDLNVDYEKFNVLWREDTKDHRVNDCLHLFNYKFINTFKDALIECPYKKCIHHICLYLKIDNHDINILFKDYYDSNSDKQENPVYTIARGYVIQDLSQNFWNKYLKYKRFNFM
jgi:hypothetical protein